MRRFYQVLLIGTFLPLCWLGMMAVHELGHVSAAVASGGRVKRVVVHPLTISRTDLASNPHPLFVVWAGPTVGVVLPLALAVVLGGACKVGWAYLVRFFAGFCLVANGCYIGVGAFQGIGDAGVMLLFGSPRWCLWLFGLAAVPLGLCLWNGLGPHFGLGKAAGEVDRRAAYASAVLLLVTAALASALSPSG
jgi:hypothetical protein